MKTLHERLKEALEAAKKYDGNPEHYAAYIKFLKQRINQKNSSK